MNNFLGRKSSLRSETASERHKVRSSRIFKMRFSRNTAVFGFLVTLFVGQIGHSVGKGVTLKNIDKKKTAEEFGKLNAQTTIKGVIEVAIPAAAVIFPPPLGPALSVSLGIMYGIYRFSEGSQPDLKWEKVIAEKVENLEKQLTEKIERSTEILITAIESYDYLKKLRERLDSMSSTYSYNIVCILNDKCEKSDMLKILTNSMSEFRMESRDFTTNYLHSPLVDPQKIHPEKFYFDFIIQKEHFNMEHNEFCHNATYYTRIFEVYNLIRRVLTENYVLIIAGNVAQHQEAKTTDPGVLETRRNGIIDLGKEYLGHIKTLMTKTKWALGQSSREIRNCGKFELKRGKTFERLNFISTRFQINRPKSFFDSTCVQYDRDGIFKNDGFHMFKCEPFNIGNDNDIYIDLADNDRPYHHMVKKINLPMYLEKEIYGRTRSERTEYHNLIVTEKKCDQKHCSAYKPSRVGVSTQGMQAQPGYVITGVRWRVKNDIFYIQIQEGKYIDSTQVNKSTVHWVETEIKSDDIIYLDDTIREIDLDDTDVGPDFYVRYVRLVVFSGRRIILFLKGQKGTESGLLNLWATTSLFGLAKQELNIDGDDPEMNGNNSNVYLKDRGARFVKFQATDIKKDFGRTTIPYFDLRDVVTDPPAPISGIGIYHQAFPGFGGFISLKMLSPDYSNMIDFEKLKEFSAKFQLGVNWRN